MSLATDIARIERRVATLAEELRPAPAPEHVRAFDSLATPVAVRSAIVAAARRAGVDPALVAAVAKTESNGDPNARSAVGAQGLMQLMPDTARSLGVTDPYDPAQNVRAGAAYLRTLLDRFGNLRSALAAYNAGPEAVARFGGVPPYRETRAYVEHVLDAYRTDRAR